MGMNIGPMLRALLGETAPSNGRALELRIGQIVRGVLLEMLENGEALMNIGGVPVRAKLEADLPIGRGTLLQVQASSGGGTIVLRPLADDADAVPDESLKNMLKTFGFPEQKWAYELLRGLKRDGYPVGKDTASYFQAAVALKPASADMAGWMNATGVAFRRGLPATEETIASLRQALFGPPLHEALADFTASFRQWMEAEGRSPPRTAEWVGRLQAQLAHGERLLAQGEELLLGAAAFGTDAPEADAVLRHAAGQAAYPGQAASPDSGKARTGAIAQPAVPGTAEDVFGRTPASGSVGGSRPAPGLLTGGNPSASAPSRPAVPLAAPPVEPDFAAAAARSAEAKPGDLVPRPSAAGQETAGERAVRPDAAANRGESSWIGRFLQWLGVDHEHRLLGGSSRPGGDAAWASAPSPLGDETATAGSLRGHADNLKSALLTLAAHDEAPPALREAAQTLAQQVTGQQLLLASERQPNQPFSMMTMFIPMKSPDGDTTAAVHVQARRSRKGEWDADNCRLLFDLRMRHLGDTVVDVQVVNRIVSVKLLNDYPGMADLVEQAREELETGLRDAGFQLLSMTAQPLPSRQAAGESESVPSRGKPNPNASSAYAFKPYKGVDFRI